MFFEMEVLNERNSADILDTAVNISGDECRICLKKCSNPSQLFHNDKEILRKLMAFAHVQIAEGDGLPTAICSNCHQLLDISYDFKQQIEKSDIKLREILRRNIAMIGDTKDISSVKCFIDDVMSEMCHQDISNCTDHIATCENTLSLDQTNSIVRIDETSNMHQQENPCNDHILETAEDNKVFQDLSVHKHIDKVINLHPQGVMESDLYEKFKVKNELMCTEESEIKIHNDPISNSTVINTTLVENINVNDTLHKADTTVFHSDEEKPLISRRTRQKRTHRVESFASKLALRRQTTARERRTNMKVRYVCYVCERQFSTVEKLKNHIFGDHEKEDSKAARENSQDRKTKKGSSKEEQFGKNDVLHNSKRERRNREFICEVCSKRFAYRKSFLSHAKSHPEYTSESISNNSCQSLDPLSDVKDIAFTLKVGQCNNDDNDEDDDIDEEGDSDLPVESLQCTQCGKLFATKRNLKRHISTHSGIKYECTTCGKEFSRIDKLKDHEQSKHKDEMFGQSEEEEHDEDEDVLNDNKLQDTVENKKKEKQHNRPHKCGLCPKAFAHPQSLANHTERHKRVKDTQKRFLCEVCSKCFAQSGSLVAHMRTHTGVKPYVCNVCSRAFTKSTYLQLHLRTHSGEKPYICQYCSRAFARANTLARHITMHTGEAKYHCQICTKSFRRLTSLNEHTYTHTGQRPYACKICTKRYNNAGSLYAHTKKCKAQRLSGTTTFAVSVENSTQENCTSVPQVLIYSQRKLVEETVVGQVTPAPQYMIANVHNQKTLSTNVIQPFTSDDPNLYTVNAKQFKSPYYAIYPNM